MAFAQKHRKVAVVGGGPAGLATSRFLLEYGHTPVVFESGSEVGGIWAPAPLNSVVYRGLVTNIPTMCMQSFDLDFQSGLSSYITAAELGRYLIQYADHFNLRRFVRFGHSITSVCPKKTEEQDNSGDSSWTVAWKTMDGNTASEEFEAVVVASGHYEEPFCPELPGQVEWLAVSSARRVMHSISYDDPGEFKDRVVLVVGGRSSGTDISRELRSNASWVYVLEKGCKQSVSVGNCTHVPMEAELTSEGHLKIGSDLAVGPPIDTVIFATGYTYKFSFLDEKELGLEFGTDRRFVSPLYQHILHVGRPSLCFVGLPLAVPCPVALFEAQARLVAAHLLQGWTSHEQRQAWVSQRFDAVGSRTQDLFFLGSDAWGYMLDLVSESGMHGSDLEAYGRRLRVVQAIHEDRGHKRPVYPWDDDWYRYCEYSADYSAGTFQVILPDAIRCK